MIKKVIASKHGERMSAAWEKTPEQIVKPSCEKCPITSTFKGIEFVFPHFVEIHQHDNLELESNSKTRTLNMSKIEES